MRIGQTIVLVVVVAGLVTWAAIPLLAFLNPSDIASMNVSIPAGVLNEFLARLAIFVSFCAGVVLITHAFRRLRWSENRTRQLDNLLGTARDVVPFRNDQNDRHALLKEACGRLKQSRGYESVWMTCTGDTGAAILAVQAGCSGPFAPLSEDMKNGVWPACAEKALAKSGPVIMRDTVAQCVGCHLHDKRYGRAALAMRMETEGRVHGVLCVKSTYAVLSSAEEQGVIGRVARDLGYALSAIEMRKQHGETAEELQWRSALAAAATECARAAVQSGPHLKPVAASALESLLRLTESRCAAAYRIDERTGTAALVTARDLNGELEPERSPFSAEMRTDGSAQEAGPWARAMFDSRTVIENELRARGDARAEAAGRPFRIMAAPAVVAGSVVGQLVVADSERPYGEHDVEAMESLCVYYADACRDAGWADDRGLRAETVSNSPSPTLVVAPDGAVVDANGSFMALWGVSTPEDILGSRFLDLWDTSSPAAEVPKKLLQSGHWQGELEARRTDGTCFRVSVSATVVAAVEGGEDRYVYAMTDLTEPRLAENTLRVLGRIAAKANACEKPRELYSETRQELGRVMDTRNFLVATYDAENDSITLPFFLDEKDQNQFSELPAAGTLCSRVVRDGKPVLLTSREIADLAERGEVGIVGSPCECWLGVPLTEDNAPTGVVAVQSYTDAKEYGERELTVLKQAADIIASGLSRMRAAGALAETEGHTSAVAQTVTDALIDTDSKGHILSWNRAAENLFGYTAEEAVGQPFSLIVPEGFLQAHVDGLMRAVSSEGQGYVRASVEGVGLRKDESEFPMELSIGAWRAGDETFFTAVLSDATSRKQTEEELQFLSSIPLQVSDALIVTDLNFRITYVNKAAEFLFSYSREELIGRTLDVLNVDSWDDATSDEIHQTVSAGRFWSDSHRSRRKDGSSFIVECRVSPLRDRGGRLTSYISIFHDITDRTRGEELLRALNAAALGMERSLTPDQVLETVGQELESIGLSCAVLALDETGELLDLTYASRGMEIPNAVADPDDDDGESPGVSVSSLPALRSAVSEKRAALIERDASAAAVGAAPGDNWALRTLSARSCIIVPLLAGQDVVGVLAVMSDTLVRRDIPAITAFGNQVAAAWRKANLMQELEGSLRELRRTQNILLHAQKMEAIGNLAGGVAHDFNNLLTAISGYTELLLARFDEGDPTHADLMEIKKAAHQAAGVTGQLLAFSRQQPLEPRPTLLNDVVANIDKMLRRLIGEDVELVAVLEPALGKVKADVTQLQQVIMNLAINARDAMPEGGTLSIRTENVSFSEQELQSTPDATPGDYVLLSVGDTGTGVDPEVLDRIFEPFFTTKEPGKGTGLGLSVVYGIVSQHGGWLDVSSELDKGTTFRVYLPVASDEAEQAPVEIRSARSEKGHHERVLIVEDEDTVRGFAVRALQRGGYEVLEACSAEEAVELFKANSDGIDLLFTDVVLSSRSGLELLDEIQALRPDIPALLSSGYADQKSHWEVIQERGLPFLKKPYAVADLLERVRDLIDAPGAEAHLTSNDEDTRTDPSHGA